MPLSLEQESTKALKAKSRGDPPLAALNRTEAPPREGGHIGVTFGLLSTPNGQRLAELVVSSILANMIPIFEVRPTLNPKP